MAYSQQLKTAGDHATLSASHQGNEKAFHHMSGLTVTPLTLDGVLLIVPKRFGDARGYFVETYREETFRKIGVEVEFVQDNQSFSARRGTVRGLHFQTSPAPQAKLVRVIKGAVFDVAVDLRKGSPAFGRSCSATLTAQGLEQLFIPRGFAHGFCTIEPDTEVAYKTDGTYSPQHEAGVLWNDPDIGIPWPVLPCDAILSERDRGLPRLCELASPFEV